jgi:AcrR family transcriptional regulator
MAERKRPRRTRERIIETSLALFNRLGAPNVGTADVAAEMGISPGNLYYHFRNKDAIVAELYAAFEQRLDALLDAPEGRVAGVEDLWLFLHLLFEAMWDYRFLYRDLDEIVSRDRVLAQRFRRFVGRGTATVLELCRSLIAGGSMKATEREIAALSRNAVIVATYWMSFQRIAGEADDPDENSTPSLGRAAYQVLSLIAPFLRGSDRVLIDRLSRDYL